MAESQSRTDTVGRIDRILLDLKRTIQRAHALRLANGKWQVRRLEGDWCLIAPTGELPMTGTAEDMRHWAFRMVRITANMAKPF